MKWNRPAILLLVVMALAQSGCAALLVAGGVGAGYAYYRGRVCETFRADFDQTWSATCASLSELGLPVVRQNYREGVIESRTGDWERVRVVVKTEPPKIPSDGAVTSVSVRVATFGDRKVSGRILDQLNQHLTLAYPGVSADPAMANDADDRSQTGVVPASASIPNQD